MPILKSIALNDYTQLLVWKITETFDELFSSVALKDVSLARVENMKAEGHQKGFLSVRRLLMEAGYTDFDLYYDEFGKPHLKDDRHISISHSHDYSVIVVSDVNIGADLEILKDKTLKLAPRYMDISHLENLSQEDKLIKATVIWGIKEAVFKVKNVIGISFKDHIFENDFDLSDKNCTVELRVDNSVEYLDILFDFIENYVFVCAFEKK
ncbi:4-phosphopantetheinyl transferase [Flavobacterium paronense]|uniref:4'-phosphopantetheinyl transferase family protein n=1 Tax=Flavobacterium paronense TaxID=1392775 RepID=A0ABV5GFI2_9FLAO|nr:4-phosphopantetheinyl transferase [Flavobacterium paronense]MDN3676051.1 4-phosphopantetheinyl transferase [Flavobacterium paronense]